MANTLDIKLVVKHLANGTLGEHLCVICLLPLKDSYENIFTKVCREDHEYCIAEILATVCKIKFTDLENYNVCLDCFVGASTMHKFYLLTKRSEEIINFYTEELIQSVDNIIIPDQSTTQSLCITLSQVMPVTPNFDFNIEAIKSGKSIEETVENPSIKTIKKENIQEDDNVVVVIDDGKQLFFKVVDDGLMMLDENEQKKYSNTLKKSVNVPEKITKKRKRDPMAFITCSQCPVKYRFVAKLREHMMTDHGLDFHYCKVCKTVIENKLEYQKHIKMHTNVHQCEICNMVFKRRQTIIKHLAFHEKMRNMKQEEGVHVCEICGVALENEDKLKEHYRSKHDKKYTCYYCGRMYKGQLCFESHVRKHEQHQKKQSSNVEDGEKSKQPDSSKRRSMCSTCGKHFVDDRALLWHQRLHNNERPYTCNECGRGFVSLNRRNQHTLCAHTPPARRCPLCPALFHLRSMVNSHIKKVHLKAHKRRNRTSKHQNVFWRTETVPIQELSVSIQNEILELQAMKESDEWII